MSLLWTNFFSSIKGFFLLQGEKKKKKELQLHGKKEDKICYLLAEFMGLFENICK